MNFKQIKKILNNKHVGIAGAGGLGSNCAASLTRCGLGKLTLTDFDSVSPENLNRQFFFQDQVGMKKVEALAQNLWRINPEIQLNIHPEKLSSANICRIFDQVDVLVEAFDLAEEKVMLIETALDHWPERPLVAGSGMAGLGETDQLHIRQSGNLYICGDESTEISQETPPIAPRVTIVANLQADQVIRLLIT